MQTQTHAHAETRQACHHPPTRTARARPNQRRVPVSGDLWPGPPPVRRNRSSAVPNDDEEACMAATPTLIGCPAQTGAMQMQATTSSTTTTTTTITPRQGSCTSYVSLALAPAYILDIWRKGGCRWFAFPRREGGPLNQIKPAHVSPCRPVGRSGTRTHARPRQDPFIHFGFPPASLGERGTSSPAGPTQRGGRWFSSSWTRGRRQDLLDAAMTSE